MHRIIVETALLITPPPATCLKTSKTKILCRKLTVRLAGAGPFAQGTTFRRKRWYLIVRESRLFVKLTGEAVGINQGPFPAAFRFTP